MTEQGRSLSSLLSISLLLFLGFSLAEYLLLASQDKSYTEMCRWDCAWYNSIVDSGYMLEPTGHSKGDAANWAFFPLHPMLGRLVANIIPLDIGVPLVVTSKFFSLVSIFAFLLMTSAFRPGISPWRAGAVVVCGPYFVYGNVGYSEPLFFSLSCVSLYFLHKKHFIVAGLFGGLLSATRIVGGSIGFSYLRSAWTSWRQLGRWGEISLGLCLIPLGLACYMGYLYWLMGDALAFMHIQVAWQHAPGDIVGHIGRTLRHPIETWPMLLVLAQVVFAFFLLFQLFRRGFDELFIFSLVATLIPLSTGLISMPRYIWWQPPILFALTLLLADIKRPLFIAYILSSSAFSLIVYVAWVNGKSWVI